MSRIIYEILYRLLLRNVQIKIDEAHGTGGTVQILILNWELIKNYF